MKIIMPEQAHSKIDASDGKIFTVVFRRKNDKTLKDPETGRKVVVAKAGDLREMNCRTKVKSKRKTSGKGKVYVFCEHDLVSVYDMKAKGYRSFSWKNVVFLKINKEKYIVLSQETLDYCRQNPTSDITQTVENSGVEI